MPRYINLDELLTSIDKRNGRLPLWLDEILMEDCKVADVQPVEHGHWIVTEYYNPSEFGEEEAYTFKCSECGNAYHSTMGMSYCMDCGAKMDGDPE